MKRALLVLLACAACTKPTPEERKTKYAQTLEQEMQAASSSYALFTLLKHGIGAEVPECTSEQLGAKRTYRLSMAHLELLNGAPHENGVLVVELPSPDGFDNLRGFPPRLVTPADVSDSELEKLVKELRAAHAAMKNADGFLVQRVDSYTPPVLRTKGFVQTSGETGFEPGSLSGRVFAFDGVGKPVCFVPYEASGASDAGVDLAMKDLNLSLRRAFRERLGVPE